MDGDRDAGDTLTALERLQAALSDLQHTDLDHLDPDTLITVTRAVEQVRRQLPAVEHRLIAALDDQRVASDYACRDTATLLNQLLLLAPADAKRRVQAARDLGPRRALTGQFLPPLFPHVATAQATGQLSADHAAVITAALDRLPPDIQTRHGDAVQATLVQQATRLDPRQLATAAHRITDTLNPDGAHTDNERHQQLRGARLVRYADGSGRLDARLTPGCLARLETVLHALAAPRPADDGGVDPRTASQRMHDAIDDASQRLLRGDDLPDSGGVPTTVLVTMTVDQLETRLGVATTATGGAISVPAALELAAAADVIPVVLSAGGGILGYGRSRRCASPAQRLALAARDRGCSFPGCDAPASWCEAHHVVAWQDGGPTDINNLTLLCGYHHREHAKRGWTVHITDGVPEWTPPRWLDPHQRSRRNTALAAELDLVPV